MMQADMLRCGSCKVVSLPCLRTCAVLSGCSLSLLYTLGRVGSVARAKLDERIAELLPEVERLRKADRKRLAHPKTSWFREKHLSWLQVSKLWKAFVGQERQAQNSLLEKRLEVGRACNTSRGFNTWEVKPGFLGGFPGFPRCRSWKISC